MFVKFSSLNKIKYRRYSTHLCKLICSTYSSKNIKSITQNVLNGKSNDKKCNTVGNMMKTMDGDVRTITHHAEIHHVNKNKAEDFLFVALS